MLFFLSFIVLGKLYYYFALVYISFFSTVGEEDYSNIFLHLNQQHDLPF